MTKTYTVRHLDGLWCVVDARWPNVLSGLPFDTEAEALEAVREEHAILAEMTPAQVVFTGPISL